MQFIINKIIAAAELQKIVSLFDRYRKFYQCKSDPRGRRQSQSGYCDIITNQSTTIFLG